MGRGLLFRKFFAVFSLVISFSPIVFLFQNCSEGFQASQFNSLSSASLAVCMEGQIVSGYLANVAKFPGTCTALQSNKTCVGGQWTSAQVLYPNCIQQCVRTDNQQVVDAGASYTTYVAATAASQALCDAATNKITSTCDQATGTFLPAPANPTCLAAGQVCAYASGQGLATPTGNMTNATVTGYVAQSAIYPNKCNTPVTRTCQASGQWTGSTPVYTACTQRCIHPGTNMPVDQGTTYNYVYYTLATGTKAQCDAAKVTLASTCSMTTGLFAPAPPANTYATCSEATTPVITSITANSTAVSFGQMLQISWVTSGATTLRLDPGAVTVTGTTSYSFIPTQSTAYTLTASNPAGSVTMSTPLVTVNISIDQGKTLYANNCASCHGALAQSTKIGRAPTQIKAAINTVAAMNVISGLKALSSDQIYAISVALGGAAPITNQCVVAQEPGGFGIIRRFSSTEFINMLSDLLYIPSVPGAALPSEGYSGDGFDNSGGIMSMDTARLNALLDRVDAAVTEGFRLSKATLVQCPTAAATASNTPACVREVMTRFAKRAYRKTPTTAEIDSLVSVVNQATTRGEVFQDAIGYGFKAAILAPQALYIPIIKEQPMNPAVFHDLTDFELATRLANFLWAGLPDDTLLDLAAKGQLKDTAVLTQQVQRMLKVTAKAQRFSTNYSEQWLNTRQLMSPVYDSVPEMDLDLRNAYKQETDMFFAEHVTSDLNPLNILTANYTYANQRSATQYGLSGVTGTQMRKVPLAGTTRKGALTQGAILSSRTSYTSVIHRGHWVLEQITCNAPPPPPADLQVGTLNDTSTPSVSIRERLALHEQRGTSCFACHSQMDPVGLGFEFFDGFGRYRTTVNGIAVDASGKLYDKPFQDHQQMADILAQSEDYKKCLTKKLMTYALGRTLKISDQCAVDQIAASAVSGTSKFSDLLTAIVLSEPFRKQRGEKTGE